MSPKEKEESRKEVTYTNQKLILFYLHIV